MKQKYLKRYQSEYQGAMLKNVSSDPLKLFTKWYRQASKSRFIEPNAMTLATSDGRGQPSARVVLLKSYDKSGLVFFTNYRSRKGREIEHNPKVALLFYWDKLERQVRIEGRVETIDSKESDRYFKMRPFGAQLAATISAQSNKCRSLTLLEQKLEKLKRNVDQVVRPTSWGGYRVVPTYYEFWEGRPNRLHSRVAYKKASSGWRIFRLQP